MEAACSLVAMDANNMRGTIEGRRIAARRAFLGKSGPDIERETDGAVYTKLLSRIETGKVQVKNLPYSKLRRLMFALEWTPTQFAEELGLELPNSETVGTEYSPRHVVPVFESVSAGLASTPSEDAVIGHYAIDPGVSGMRGRDMTRMRILPVNGDSMATSDVQKSIPHGSYVVVEVNARPQPGDLVVAWIDDLDVAVLKEYGEDPSVVLTSYNPQGPVFRANEVDLDIRGVVRMDFRKR